MTSRLETAPWSRCGAGPSGSAEGGWQRSFNPCTEPELELVTLGITLTTPSPVLAFAQSRPRNVDTAEPVTPVGLNSVAELRQGSKVVASMVGTQVWLEEDYLADHTTIAGHLLDPATGTVYTAPPGSYTLRLLLKGTTGPRCPTVAMWNDSQLSYQALSGS